MSEHERTMVGTISTELSLAVQLRDTFADGQPRGSPRVGLADRDEQFSLNPSDYYVLTDLPDEVTSVTVVVDAGDRYLPEQREVDLSELDPLNPVETIELHPSPSYRFPSDATLIRGIVLDADGEPLPDAELSVDGWPAATRSDRNGEFVLFLAGLTADDVTDGSNDENGGQSGNGNGGPPGNGNGGPPGNGGPQSSATGGSQGNGDGSRTVTIDGGDPVVRATHPTAGTATESVVVEERSTAVLNVEY